MDLSTDGPMAHTISDVEILLALSKGPVCGDPSAVPLWEPRPHRPRRLLAAPRTYDWGPLPARVAQAFERALGVCETELSLPIELISAADICSGGNPDLDWFTICCAEQAHQLGRELLAERADDFDPVFLEYMHRGMATSIEDYLDARRRRFAYVHQLDELLGSDSVLVTPTLVTEGFLPDGRMTATSDAGVDPAILNTVLQNITGHPAITLPAGTLGNGLPFGMQLTAPRFHDGTLLSLGREWETARPWPMTAPGYAPFAIGSL
jgi:Asp-tRNA(Asn)/Glu-tRNA(Gln) amidotransferase A subunit family amidase